MICDMWFAKHRHCLPFTLQVAPCFSTEMQFIMLFIDIFSANLFLWLITILFALIYNTSRVKVLLARKMYVKLPFPSHYSTVEVIFLLMYIEKLYHIIVLSNILPLSVSPSVTWSLNSRETYPWSKLSKVKQTKLLYCSFFCQRRVKMCDKSCAF